jgi:hypothetical protein
MKIMEEIMCGGSEANILGKSVNVYMGYYGGSITIGDNTYSVNKEQGNTTAGEMLEILSSYHPKELAQLVIDLIDNADE